MSYGNDRRAFFRCTILGHREGRLRIKGRDVRVTFVEESANGVGIVLDGLLACDIGQIATLQAGDDREDVRIVNRRIVEMNAVDESGNPIVRVVTRLGLLRQLELPPRPGILKKFHRACSSAALCFPRDNPVLAAAAPTALVVGIVFAVVFVQKREVAIIQRVRPEIPRATQTIASKPLISMPAARPVGRSNRKTVPATPLEVVRWSRLEFLLEPQVARQLGLSLQQRDQLRQLEEASQTPARSGKDESTKSIGNSVLSILTAEQRKAWFSMLADEHFYATHAIPSSGRGL